MATYDDQRNEILANEPETAARLTPELIAAITYKIRAYGLVTESGKQEVVDALTDLAIELETGADPYETHGYNKPVDDLVAAMLDEKRRTHNCPSCDGGSVVWSITCPVCQNEGKVSQAVYDRHRRPTTAEMDEMTNSAMSQARQQQQLQEHGIVCLDCGELFLIEDLDGGVCNGCQEPDANNLDDQEFKIVPDPSEDRDIDPDLGW